MSAILLETTLPSSTCQRQATVPLEKSYTTAKSEPPVGVTPFHVPLKRPVTTTPSTTAVAEYSMSYYSDPSYCTHSWDRRIPPNDRGALSLVESSCWHYRCICKICNRFVEGYFSLTNRTCHSHKRSQSASSFTTAKSWSMALRPSCEPARKMELSAAAATP